MNSLSGKFGQRPNFEEDYIYSAEEFDKIHNNFKYRAHKISDSHYWVVKNTGYSNVEDKSEITRDSVLLSQTYLKMLNQMGSVALISAVTAYGRIRLDQYVREIEKNKGLVAYCDTDSIIATKPLPTTFIGNDLGDMTPTHGVNGFIDEYVSLGKKVKSVKVGDRFESTFRGFNQNKADLTAKEIHDHMVRIIKTYDITNYTNSNLPLMKLEYSGLSIN